MRSQAFERLGASTHFRLSCNANRVLACALALLDPDASAAAPTERLGRLLLTWWNYKALFQEFLTYGWIVDGSNGGGVQPADDVLRRPLGDK